MINELSKKDTKWRLYALKICGDKSLADDIVNDMYLKVYDKQLDITDLKDSYFYSMMYHLFIDYKREEVKYDKLKTTYKLKKILDSITDENVLEKRHMITQALEELHLFDCEVLLHTHERSLRDNEDLLGVQFTKLHYWKKRAMEKIKDTETIKKYKK